MSHNPFYLKFDAATKIAILVSSKLFKKINRNKKGSRMSPMPNHLFFIQRKRCETDLYNLNTALEPCYEVLENALPHLDKILKELRGNRTTSQEFQNLLCTVLDKGDYSAKTLCELMRAYSGTHNNNKASDWKPVVSIAQQAHKIIDNIDDILLSMKMMLEQKEALEGIISRL